MLEGEVEVGVLGYRPGGILAVLADEIDGRPAVLVDDLLQPGGALLITLALGTALALVLVTLEHLDQLVVQSLVEPCRRA
ncbi:hypothetical protein [Micromonospora rhizosphaerae]|uniref:hypothetical protein n=1 Tax=Micromonospora rhizosphaerae TaxID=568872 RepID=UPI00114C908D|nr:hypothetical protein [Micromonospora rhizosphaerae]